MKPELRTDANTNLLFDLAKKYPNLKGDVVAAYAAIKESTAYSQTHDQLSEGIEKMIEVLYDCNCDEMGMMLGNYLRADYELITALLAQGVTLLHLLEDLDKEKAFHLKPDGSSKKEA